MRRPALQRVPRGLDCWHGPKAMSSEVESTCSRRPRPRKTARILKRSNTSVRSRASWRGSSSKGHPPEQRTPPQQKRRSLGGSGGTMTEQTARSQPVHRWYTRPVFFVADVNRAVRFYVDRLGFEKAWHSGDGAGKVCQVGHGECEIILCED